MARYECPRCEKVCYTTDPPHLCKDVQRRHERRERMAVAAQAELYGKVLDTVDTRALAEAIVERLMGMGVTDDI